MKSVAFAVASLVCAAAFAPQANAIERLESTNAAGVCQGALPNFETNLRKRPSGIINQSSSAAFVSCSTTQNFFTPDSASSATDLGVLLTNSTAAEVTVNCTMVAGLNYVGFMSPMQYPKSITVPANASSEGGWNAAADNAGTPFPPSLNLSCNLPAGVEIGAVYWYSPEDGTAAAATAPPV